MTTRRQGIHGFTMIELVVVITILAILAAVVLPKMADLTEDAHRATVQATRGAFTSGVLMVQAQWLARGKPGEITNLEGFGAGDVDTSILGWPVSTTSNVTNTAMTPARCVEVWNGILIAQSPRASTVAGANVDYVATAAGTVCTFTYQATTSPVRTITYDANTGDVGGLSG